MRAVLAVVAVAVLAPLSLFAVALSRQQSGGRQGFGVNAVGKLAEVRVRAAPDLTLDLYGGGTFRLGEQRGNLVAVNFWASWCPPCREEAPILARVADTYRDRGVLFVGVGIWDSGPDAEAFLKKFGVRYPNGPDPDGTIAIDYGLTGIPETYVIDRSGMLVRRWIGPLTEAQLVGVLEGALS